MARTRTVKLGNRKRRFMNVAVEVEVPETHADGSLVMGDGCEPVTRTERRTYRVPLMGSLKSGEMLLFRTPKGEDPTNMDAIWAFHQLLSRYIPSDVVDELDMEDLDAFFSAWEEASAESDGTTLGE